MGRIEEEPKARSLFEKLQEVFRDPELNLAIGGYILELAISGMVNVGSLTKEESDKLRLIHNETYDSMLTPEEHAAQRFNDEGDISKPESDYVRVGLTNH